MHPCDNEATLIELKTVQLLIICCCRNLPLAGPQTVQGPEAAARGLRGGRAALRVGEDRRPPLRDLLHRPRQQEDSVRESCAGRQGSQSIRR